MSWIKSYSVGNGDMFYINHNTDNFTIIDCCLEERSRSNILNEIGSLSDKKSVTRFISTHPDEDHIRGLEYLDDKIGILNFYCVRNSTTKDVITESFRRYRRLHDSDKAYHVSKGCTRRWMNLSSEERGGAGIHIVWPDLDNAQFNRALQNASIGNSPNNISPIIEYSLKYGVTALWMGDLEKDFLFAIENDVQLPQTDILFAPHHGRESGKIPRTMLKSMNPTLIVIGEAPSGHLDYYQDYQTITQNSAGDIVFECLEGKVRVFTSSKSYTLDFLHNENVYDSFGLNYVGTLRL